VLIAIEGIDGAGKRTQTLLLKERIEAAGFSVGMISFPRYGETFMADAIADYLNGHFGAIDTIPAHFPALLYAMDRFESRELVCQLLKDNDVLLADRYVASNLAYQSGKLSSAEQATFIAWLSHVEYEIYGLPPADLTLYLDVPVTVSSVLVGQKEKRSYTDEKADLHERNTVYLALCRDVYGRLCHAQHASYWLSVQCVDRAGDLRSIASIHAEVWKHISCHLSATLKD